jgi:hypothetical protein
MTFARKHFCLAILMGLLIGHFGMAVHASTHAFGEASECELCLSYNDSSEALASPPEQGVAPLKEAAATVEARDASEKRLWAPFLQRDPPRSS